MKQAELQTGGTAAGPVEGGGLGSRPGNKHRRPACVVFTPLLMSLTYMAIGALWILFTDRILNALVTDHVLLERISIAKGWLYVLVTGVLLYLIVSRSFSRIRRSEAAALQSQNDYRHVSQLSSDYVYALTVRPDGTTAPEWTTEAFERLTGYTWDEYVQKGGLVSIVHPDDLDAARAFMDAVDRGEATELQHRVITKDGRTLWMQRRVQPIWDESQERVVRVYGAARDITREVVAEKTLTMRAAQQEYVAELGQLALGGAGTEELLAEAVRILKEGLEADHAGALELLPGDERFAIRARTGAFEEQVGVEVPAAGTQAGYTLKVREPVIVKDLGADGRFDITRATLGGIMVSGISVAVPGLDKPWGVLASHTVERREFTHDDAVFMHGVASVLGAAIERRVAEQATRDSEEMFRQLAESIPHIVWVGTPDGKRLIYMNKSFETVFGRSRDSVFAEPQSWFGMVYPDDIDVVRREFTPPVTTELSREYRITRDDGSVRWIRGMTVPIRNEKGEVFRIAGLGEDITERKAAEAQLVQAQKMEGLGRLAGGVAHDFNNLLVAILGHAELAEGKLAQSDPAQVHLRQVRRAADRAASLTSRLLAFARGQISEPRRVDLGDLVQSMEPMLRTVVGEEFQLVIDRADDLWPAKAAPGLLEQVIVNLIVNARDAMARGGRIRVETSNASLDEQYVGTHPDVTPGDYVMLAVSDTGEGMSDEVKARAFDPFFTTKEGKGTGLGLAICYGIVKQGGGHIWIYSELGQGTTIKVLVPKATGDAEELPEREPQRKAPKASETVLVVEDDADVRAVAMEVLKRNGYTVVEASGPRSAVESARTYQGPIHAIVTDVVLPGMRGQELAERVNAERPGIKVLFMSGYSDGMLSDGGELPAGTAFLAKPFTPSALEGKLRELLDSKS